MKLNKKEEALNALKEGLKHPTDFQVTKLPSYLRILAMYEAPKTPLSYIFHKKSNQNSKRE